MSRALYVVSAIAALALLWLAIPNLAAWIVRAPGQQAVLFASHGADLHQRSFERARDGLHRAARVRNHRRDFADLLIINENLGRQQVANVALRDRLYVDGMAAFRHSLTFSPVDPTGWLLAAQMHFKLDERAEAAQALSWSLRTSIYRRHHALPRTLVGIAVWDLLDDDARDRLVHSIETVFAEAPDGLVHWIAERGFVDEVSAYLAARADHLLVAPALAAASPEAVLPADTRPADTALMETGSIAAGDVAAHQLTFAERFAAAVEGYVFEREAALENQREALTMRRTLLAGSLLLTASLPDLAEAMTIAEYVDIRDGGYDAASEARLNDYLGGVLDGLHMLGALNRQDDVALFCMPQEDVIAIDLSAFRAELDLLLAQLQEEVPGFLEFARTRSVGLAALQLLVVQHPCDG